MMYSVGYIMTVTNSVEIFHSYEKFDGMIYSVGYFTCDIFGEYRCEKFGRNFHM